jgi:hypothetical protein
MREILQQPVELSAELRQKDRRALDDAIFRMIGIENISHRNQLISELYEQTAQYHRFQRTLEIQGMRNRSAAGKNHISPEDLAASIWDSLTENEKSLPVLEWIEKSWPELVHVNIPDGKASLIGADDMFNPNSVNFRQGEKKECIPYSSSEHAGLVVKLAALEIRGDISIPQDPQVCKVCLDELNSILKNANLRFNELAESRTGQEQIREKLVFIMMNWFIHGRPLS